MSKREIGLFLAAFILLTAGFLFSLDTRELQVYPYGADSGNAYYVAHEGVEKDWSQVSDYSGKDGYLYFRYTLSKALAEPFAALYIHKVAGPDLHFDFSGFDEIRIRLKSRKGKRIPIFLTVDNRNFHPKSEVFLSMPLVKVIDYDGEHEYRLHKKDFEIPSWWLRYHGLKSEDVGKIDYSKIDYIMINSCQTLQPGDSDEIGVGSIVFAHSHALNYRIYGGLLFLLMCAAGLRIFLLKRDEAAPRTVEVRVPVPYRAKEVETSRSGAKTGRIVRYIAEHYAEPGLTVTDVEKALGISAREIGSLMRKEFDSSFKSYLNRTRLAEIKRMLVETDLPVSDIAYRTGYNNIPHFNRIFKTGAGRDSLIGRKTIPMASWLAAISYSLYLVHKAMYHVVQAQWGTILTDHGLLAFLVYGSAAIAAGAMLHYAVERPFLRLRERLPHSNRKEAASAPA